MKKEITIFTGVAPIKGGISPGSSSSTIISDFASAGLTSLF